LLIFSWSGSNIRNVIKYKFFRALLKFG
jgi:hypothetical protein